jgi:hypothetical protein
MRIETTTVTAAKKLSSVEFYVGQPHVYILDTHRDVVVHQTVAKHRNFYAVDTGQDVLDSKSFVGNHPGGV